MKRAGWSLLLAGVVGLAARGAEVQLRGERLVLRADTELLSDVLTEFARAGVRVQMDPGLAKAVLTADVREEDTEQALKRLLDPYGYALFWQTVSTPLGRFPRLCEIRVYEPGHPERLVDLAEGKKSRRVSRGADGKAPPHLDRELLIALKPGTTLGEFLALLSSIGGTPIEHLGSHGAWRIRLPAGADAMALAAKLKDDSRVRTAEPNYAVYLPLPAAGSSLSSDLGPMVSSGADGVRVAVLDSGLALPEGWKIPLAGAYDAVQPGAALSDPAGHGTQMALVASGAVTPEGGRPPAGEGPAVLAVRAFDENGLSSSYDLMRAIDYAIDQNARVVSLSWGTETSSAFLADAVERALDAGVLVVAAAGNEPTGNPVYPAALSGVLAVAATDATGQRWAESNYGDFVDLAAPGYASFPVGYNGPAGRYAGTSAATAYTAQIAARWFALHPDATPADAAQALGKAVTDAGATGADPQYGAGILDAAAAKRFLGEQ